MAGESCTSCDVSNAAVMYANQLSQRQETSELAKQADGLVESTNRIEPIGVIDPTRLLDVIA